MTYMHGGNVYEIATLMGCSPEAILDFSASINPLGPPRGLMEELQAYSGRLQHYPDIHNRGILESIADRHGIAPGRVAVGNGSTELIYWLPRVLSTQRAAIVLPTFSEYRKAFDLEGTRLSKIFCSAEKDFQPTVEQLDGVCEALDPQAILFTHPASPAGTVMPQAVRHWILEKSRAGNLRCIVDEVFVDFCEEESLKPFLDDAPGLVLIRSMTKFYGVPGLRLGYLLASESVISRCRRYLPPWSVSTFAQIGGVHCLNQDAYRQSTLDLIGRERVRLFKGLAEIPGFHVFEGRANYLLVQMDGRLPAAGSLQEYLLQSHGILIRDCSTFEGLGDHHFRVAVRLPEQNQRLLEGITQWAASRS